MNWSPYQQAIFNFITHDNRNAVVEAVAGSGKTTTIVEGLKRVTSGVTLFLAFNKAIAEELKRRGVNARTFHSLTYGPVTQHLGVRQVNTNKTKQCIDRKLTREESQLYFSFICKLVSLAKQSGIGCLVDDNYSEWRHLVDHHNLTLDGDKTDIEDGIELSRMILKHSNETDSADFDDLLYLAVLHGVSLPKYDFVFVDEAQDTNAIQRAILRKVLKPGARMIAVGDPAQAIYGFRGSDSDSLDLITSEFNCERLPLTVSYRCPREVVKHAQQWVNHIEAFDGAEEGQVTNMKYDWDTAMFEPGDMIVSRNVKPMIQLAYRMLKARGTAPHVLGREIGAELKNLVNKMKAKGIDQLLVKLGKWKDREVEKATARMLDNVVDAVTDKYEAIVSIVEGMHENERTVPKLTSIIDELFSEKTGAAILCTIHKSKGLEAERVYWLNSSKMPAPYARMPWQKQQEKNLCYVATTRAQKQLILIEDR